MPADETTLLEIGELELVGRLLDASNATFLVNVRGPAAETRQAIYKPTRGERPLFDFPVGTLANRERAAYLLSEQTGWRIVPPTVLRDGPLGRGMVQLWIDEDPEADVIELLRAADTRLRRVALFDALANNADRKGGHLLLTAGGHVHGIDHGICFAAEPKLRTVLWNWRGRRLNGAELRVVEQVRAGIDGSLGGQLRELLSRREVEATARRADDLLRERVFPQPDPSRPAVPWPPY
ncbi:SCO1664 family protein [soil metagenome]